jgi:rare lipoprotein A (peptidoglycan hydrolase)
MKQATNRPRRHNDEARARANRERKPRLARWAAVLVVALAVLPAPAFADTGGFAGPTASGTDASASSEGSLAGQELTFGAMRSGGATWYGPGFYGNRTACGLILQPTTIGVAHRSLPCGTAVRFAYRGRYIVTAVIDRGPFTRGHVWDLTNGARQALGFDGSDRLRYSVALNSPRD